MTADVLVCVPPSLFGNQGPRDLVYGCWCSGKRVGGILMPPVSSVLIATVLHQNGISADFHDFSFCQSLAKLPENIAEYKAVVMLTSSVSFSEDKMFLKHLKQKNPNMFKIIWGSYSTFSPQESVSNDLVDVSVIGEGEQTILELLRQYLNQDSWRDVYGIAYLDKGKPIINKSMPLIENLDTLPFADRTLLNRKEKYYNPAVTKYPYTTMYTSRGCFGSCVFCTSSVFYGKKIRMRSSENVIAEIKYVVSKGYKEIFFRDENFTTDRKRIVEICTALLDQNIDIKWICSSRSDCLDDELAALMKKSGCHMVRLGIESGNDEILHKAGKNITTADSQKAVMALKKNAISVHAHMLLGLPEETKETVNDTINFAVSLNPDIATFGICTPYPGTKLWDNVLLKTGKHIDADACNLNMLHKKAYYNKYFCNMGEEALEASVRRAYLKFYLRFAFISLFLKNNFSVIGIKKLFVSGARVLLFILGK